VKEPDDIDPFDQLPLIRGYPGKDELPVEDMPVEWQDEDREMEGRTPDLGELEDDPSEL
jgi:hypothetical protein